MKKMKILSKLIALSASLLIAGNIGIGAVNTTTVSAATGNDFVSKYRSDASSAADALAKAEAINEKLVDEGIVLLKNENKSLPMQVGKKISVFGKNSVNPFYGGGGSASGADGSGQGGVKSNDLYGGLANAGFIVNPDLKAFYNNNSQSGSGRDGGSGTGQVATRTGETPVASYSNDLKASFNEYNDAALVFIARAGGEGADLKTNYGSGTAGRSNYNNNGDAATGDHYLELDDNEKDMIAMVKENFDNVIIVLNMGTSFELGSLKEDTGIDSIMWIGYPGGTGFKSLGKVLNGEVTPSGRLVDIYAADFKADPTFANFATNYTSQYKNQSGGNTGINYVEYDEGIYLGYRYYETRGFVEDDNCEWYNENVVYPFGYGLSYTTFSKSVNFVTKEITADGKIEAEVTVTNTGSVPGKEVVQMFYTAPYVDGEIEKSHISLGGFEKTDLLQPGQSQTLTVSLTVRDMASYDYNDANANGFMGYELDGGEYVIYVGDTSHIWADENAASKTYTLDDGIQYKTDEVTETEIENRFDYVSEYFNEESTEVWGGHSKLMSRTDFEGTFPTPPTAEEATITSEETTAASYVSPTEATDQGQPWYTDKMPTVAAASRNSKPISATRLVGLDYNDRRWDSFMDQLTLEEMAGLVMHGFFTTEALEDLDVPMSITPDGPTGFVQGSGSNWVGNTCTYASPIVIASTWNKALALEQGEAVGDEGIWGGEKSNGIKGGYNGWYAPGNNIHRSPFSGRNFEYYSEDPILAGQICANVVKGAQSKGVFVMMKHFALNDQETNRGNLATWADEQTMREIYLKAFEISVKDGGATGMMSAFNRIGNQWVGFSYSILTEVLRNEWGFNGVVITDWVNSFMQADMMVRAGNDLWLARGNVTALTNKPQTATHVAAIRRAAKSVLYAVVNSNAMNRLGARYTSEHFAANDSDWSVNLDAVNKGGAVSYDAKSNIYKGYEYVLNGAPKGITIDKTTGMISGTVAQDASAGNYNMTVSLKDEAGYIGQAINIKLTVNGDLNYVGETNAKIYVGEFGRVNVASELLGTTVTYTTEGTLPAGMALSADGAIIGKPTATGSSTFTVIATAGGNTVSKEVTINVAERATLTYTGSALTAGKEGEAYTANVATATGAAGITYTAAGLPEGLTIAADGTISGTPTTAGSYTIIVTASAEDCYPVSAQFTLTVEAAAQPNPPVDQPPVDQPPAEEPGFNLFGCFGVVNSSSMAFIALGAFATVFMKKKETRN